MIKPNYSQPIIFANEGPLHGQKWTVDRNLVIGRDSDCDISIMERQISRLHARIEPIKEYQVRIVDLESKNGTYVNGERIVGSQILEDGDEIKIALIQELVFVSSDATIPLDLSKPFSVEKSRKLFIDENISADNSRKCFLDFLVLPE